MLGVKKYLVQNLVKFKPVHSIPGRVRLKIKATLSNYKEFESYDNYLQMAVKLLDGIEDVDFNYTIGTVVIKYDQNKLCESKIIKWLNSIVYIGMENKELISRYSSDNQEDIVKTLKEQLIQAIVKL